MHNKIIYNENWKIPAARDHFSYRADAHPRSLEGTLPRNIKITQTRHGVTLNIYCLSWFLILITDKQNFRLEYFFVVMDFSDILVTKSSVMFE
jgi:hypothetical protein